MKTYLLHHRYRKRFARLALLLEGVLYAAAVTTATFIFAVAATDSTSEAPARLLSRKLHLYQYLYS